MGSGGGYVGIQHGSQALLFPLGKRTRTLLIALDCLQLLSSARRLATNEPVSRPVAEPVGGFETPGNGQGRVLWIVSAFEQHSTQHAAHAHTKEGDAVSALRLAACNSHNWTRLCISLIVTAQHTRHQTIFFFAFARKSPDHPPPNSSARIACR